MLDWGEGNNFCFELSGGSKNWGFESSVFNCSYFSWKTSHTPMHWNCVCLCYLREMPPLYMCTCNTALTDRFSSINDTLTCEIPVLLCTSDQKLRVLIYYILMSIAWFMITLHSQGFHCLSSETAKVDDTKIKRMSVFFSCTLISFLLLSFLDFFLLCIAWRPPSGIVKLSKCIWVIWRQLLTRFSWNESYI